MTIVFLDASFTYCSATELPAAKKVISALLKSKFSKEITVWSWLLNLIFCPALFLEATKNNSSTFKFDFLTNQLFFFLRFP